MESSYAWQSMAMTSHLAYKLYLMLYINCGYSSSCHEFAVLSNVCILEAAYLAVKKNSSLCPDHAFNVATSVLLAH